MPSVFVFSPLLLIVTQSFTLPEFLLAFTGEVLGIVALSVAITTWLFGLLWMIERIVVVNRPGSVGDRQLK